MPLGGEEIFLPAIKGFTSGKEIEGVFCGVDTGELESSFITMTEGDGCSTFTRFACWIGLFSSSLLQVCRKCSVSSSRSASLAAPSSCPLLTRGRSDMEFNEEKSRKRTYIASQLCLLREQSEQTFCPVSRPEAPVRRIVQIHRLRDVRTSLSHRPVNPQF